MFLEGPWQKDFGFQGILELEILISNFNSFKLLHIHCLMKFPTGLG